MLLFNVFNNKKEEGPTYRKGGEQDNISRDGTKNYTDRMKTALNINSPEINAVINNPDIKGTTLGKLTAVVGDELSFNNGKFRIKESFGKVVYMYINTSYENSIVNDIKITDNEETVLKKLGDGSSKFLSKDKILVIEHEKMYIILDIKNHKAYIYFKREMEDINKFMEYVDKYLKDRDMKTFIDIITSTYKEYDKFVYNSRKVDLTYPAFGIKIYATNYDKLNNGIKIYKNSKFYQQLKDKYFGKDSNKNNNYEVIKSQIELGVLFEDSDLVETEIREKIDRENAIGEAYINGEMNDFNVAVTGEQSEESDTQKYHGCIVCFSDPKIERYNLNTAATADSIFVTNKYIYYSLNNLGIFRLEPYTRTVSKIIENQGKIEILNIENGMMTYNANGQKYYMNNVY